MMHFILNNDKAKAQQKPNNNHIIRNFVNMKKEIDNEENIANCARHNRQCGFI